MKYSTFRHARDNRPCAAEPVRNLEELAADFDQIAWREKHPDREGAMDEATWTEAKKRLPAWSPASYPAGASRAKKNVEAVWFIVGDLDDVPKTDADAIKACLRERGIGFIAHPTPSQVRCPEGVIRERMIAALSRPVSGAEWPKAWPALIAALGVTASADPAAKDASRIYFVPIGAAYGDREFVQWHEGAPIDVDAALAAHATPEPASPPVPAHDPHKPTREHDEDGPRRYAIKAVDSAVIKLRAAPRGTRNPTLAAEAYGLGQLVGAAVLTRAEAEDALCDGVSGWDKSAESTTNATMLRQLDEGEKHPRAIPERRIRTTMNHAIQNTPDERPRAKAITKPSENVIALNAWQSAITVNKQGTPHATTANAIVVLANAWRPGTLVYDNFTNEVRSTARPIWDEVDVPPDWTAGGPWTSLDDVRTGAYLARQWGLRIGNDAVRAAVEVVARKHQVHPILDYFDTLTWDRVPRVSGLFSRYFGATPGTYSEAVSKMFMVGAVARVEDPGCKLDTMPVLEGAQGIGKSTGIKALFGDKAFSDTPLDLQSKDRFVALRGKWCIEIAELGSFERHEENRIKAFVSSPVDTYRPPYGRSDERIPRQCVFAGTTNAKDYLRDVTGNRRFFPIACRRVDLDALRADRDQLWAEARTLFEAKVPWWPSSDMLATIETEQAERVVVDSWEDAIAAYVDGKDDNDPKPFVTVTEVLSRCFALESSKHDRNAQNRVVRALVKLGRTRKQRRIDGRPTWGYVTSAGDVVT